MRTTVGSIPTHNGFKSIEQHASFQAAHRSGASDKAGAHFGQNSAALSTRTEQETVGRFRLFEELESDTSAAASCQRLTRLGRSSPRGIRCMTIGKKSRSSKHRVRLSE